MSDCNSSMMAAIFGHKFRARYSITPTIVSMDGMQSPLYAVELVEASKKKIYVHDICERCGKTVAKPGGGDLCIAKELP